MFLFFYEASEMNQIPDPRPEIANESLQPAGERPRTVLGQAYQDVAARSAEERNARAEQRIQEWRRPRDE